VFPATNPDKSGHSEPRIMHAQPLQGKAYPQQNPERWRSCPCTGARPR